MGYSSIATILATAKFPIECYSNNLDIRRRCFDSCTVETCTLNASYWGYIPSFLANVLFLSLFGLSTLVFTIQTFLSKRYLLFSISMISGGIIEVIGYAARIKARNALWTEVYYPPNEVKWYQDIF
jgi:hypothetical protein